MMLSLAYVRFIFEDGTGELILKRDLTREGQGGPTTEPGTDFEWGVGFGSPARLHDPCPV